VDKLIINHGERVTEHELGDVPLVIGRDPECDLFFADKKLSRRHARIERAGAGVKLVDLGSRNGSWVNDERIQERQIAPGDEIRLGGLRINLERSPSPAADVGDQSTLYLKGERAPDEKDESSTVLLAGGSPASPSDSSPATMALPAPTAEVPRPRAADPSTVFLDAGAVAPPPHPLEYDDPADETRKKPEPERTVVFEGRPAEVAFDTGKVVIHGQADPSLPDRVAKAAAARAAPAPPMPPPASVAADESTPSLSASVTFVPDEIVTGRSLVVRLLLVALALSLFSLLVLPIPLLRLARAAVDEESAKRARALVDLLATANEAALGEGRVEDVTVERVAGESGVTGAYIVSPGGDILAPRDRAGQKLELSGFAGSVGEVRSFRAAPLDGGETVFARPVTYRGTRVGVAVLSHRAGGEFSGWANVVLAFGSLLLLIAVAVAVLAATRMTVNPMNELRADIESLGDERTMAIPVQRAYRELSSLAVSLNRVFATRAPREAPHVRGEKPPGRH
jgi:hypothetical protein